jgi:uncharacterized protein YprB with RNaseH-like and TPR domain
MGRSLKESLAIIRARARNLRNRREAPELVDDLVNAGVVGRGPDAIGNKTAKSSKTNRSSTKGDDGMQPDLERYKSGEPGPIETIEPGEERENDGDPFYLITAIGDSLDPASEEEEKVFGRLEGWPRFVETKMYSPRPSPGKRPAGGWKPPPFGSGSVCFLDIETTGLSPTTYLFLIGLMYFAEGRFVVEQVFARNYAEEAPVLRYVRDKLAGFDSVVTYNGARFDIPFIETRLAVVRGRPLEPISSIDLLYSARKAFRGILPNNRLGTVEKHLRGFDRTGDIPGAHIPGAYHDYVRTNDARAMKNVLYHNRMDLFTMAVLINRLDRC